MPINRRPEVHPLLTSAPRMAAKILPSPTPTGSRTCTSGTLFSFEALRKWKRANHSVNLHPSDERLGVNRVAAGAAVALLRNSALPSYLLLVDLAEGAAAPAFSAPALCNPMGTRRARRAITSAAAIRITGAPAALVLSLFPWLRRTSSEQPCERGRARAARGVDTNAVSAVALVILAADPPAVLASGHASQPRRDYRLQRKPRAATNLHQIRHKPFRCAPRSARRRRAPRSARRKKTDNQFPARRVSRLVSS
jgi:hypothetical protein